MAGRTVIAAVSMSMVGIACLRVQEAVIRVFDLRGVSDDEESAMRVALQNARVVFYTTPRAGHGSGSPGLWVYDEKSAQKARVALSDAQAQWVATGRRDSKQVSPEVATRARWRIWLLATIVILVVGMGIVLPGVGISLAP